MSDKNNHSNNDSGTNAKFASARESSEDYRLRMEREERDLAAYVELEGPMDRAWRAEQGGHAGLPAAGCHSDKQGPGSQTVNRLHGIRTILVPSNLANNTAQDHEIDPSVQDWDLVDPYIAALDDYTGFWVGPVPDTSGRRPSQYQGAGQTDGTLRGGNTK